MKKYPIENFYVGKINFCWGINPEHLWGYVNTSRYFAKEGGAISGERFQYIPRTVDWENEKGYDYVFSLFYKNGYTYTCLHNGENYHLDDKFETSIDHCSDVTPLVKYIPKVSYKEKEKISILGAKFLFNKLFKQDASKIYNKTKYPIDDYFCGFIDIQGKTVETDKNNEKKVTEINLAPTLLVENKGSITDMGGSTIDKDNPNIEYFFRTYPIIALKMDEEQLYNIDDHQIYYRDSDIPTKRNKIRIYAPLVEELKRVGMEYQEKMSIPEVIDAHKILIRK